MAFHGGYDKSVSDASGIEAPFTDPLVVVHVAIGMTMEYLNCAGLEAFTALIALARETEQALWDVAADLVERRFRFGQYR